MGDAGHCCTQADQDHEGQHQVAAGGLAGARGHRAAPRHAAAVGVEDLGGRGEEPQEPLRTSRRPRAEALGGL